MRADVAKTGSVPVGFDFPIGMRAFLQRREFGVEQIESYWNVLKRAAIFSWRTLTVIGYWTGQQSMFQ